MQKNYFQKSAGFLRFYKKLFPRLLTLQTLAGAIVRFTNINKDGDMLEIEPHGRLLERKFMIHDKCYREHTR